MSAPSSVKEDLKSCKKENVLLHGSLLALQENQRQLQAELDLEKHRVRRLIQMLLSTGMDETSEGLLVRASKPQPQLHAIALRHVFEYLLPPPGILDYSLSQDPNSAVLHLSRMLKSISLVCKLWNSAMIPLFYRDLVLRRVGQLAAFARTIRSAPQTFATHVRSLTLYFYVPDRWTSVSRLFLAQVTDACHQLETLSVQGPFPAKSILSHEPDGDTSYVAALVARLSSLNSFGTHVSHPDPGGHVQFFPAGTYIKLTSLNLFVGREQGADDDPSWQLGLHFPNLKTLVLRAYRTDYDYHYTLPQSWDLPQLLDLRLWLYRTFPTSGPLSVLNFAQKYVRTLQTLDFGSSYRVSLKTQSDIAISCPHLSHLVLTICEHTDGRLGRDMPVIRATFAALRSSEVFARFIRLVDVVIPRPFPENKLLRPRLVRNGCAWGRVRYLDGYTVSQIPELPHVLPVSEDDEEVERTYDFYGYPIRESHRWVELVKDWDSINDVYSPSESDPESGACSDDSAETDSRAFDSDKDEYYMGRKDHKYEPAQIASYRNSTSSSDQYEDWTSDEPDEDITEQEALEIFQGTIDVS